MNPDRPLLKFAEAGPLVWPELPARVSARRLYRWAQEGVLPTEAILRAGRAVYLRRAAFMAWLESGQLDGKAAGR